MKKIILSLVFMCGGLLLLGQSVNDVPFSDIQVEYIRIIGTNRITNPTKLNVRIDFGASDLRLKHPVKIKDKTGAEKEWDSMIDALNFMAKNGYEFEAVHNTVVPGQNVRTYILRRKRGL